MLRLGRNWLLVEKMKIKWYLSKERSTVTSVGRSACMVKQGIVEQIIFEKGRPI